MTYQADERFGPVIFATNRPGRPSRRRRHPQEDTVPDLLANVEWVPYIRIRDVRTSDISRGSAWMSVDAAQTADARRRLRAGDILLSKSGTIGKVGIVRNGAVGAVAAAGFFVLRPNQDTLDPHYLLAFLQCAECRAWLDDRGSRLCHASAFDACPQGPADSRAAAAKSSSVPPNSIASSASMCCRTSPNCSAKTKTSRWQRP